MAQSRTRHDFGQTLSPHPTAQSLSWDGEHRAWPMEFGEGLQMQGWQRAGADGLGERLGTQAAALPCGTQRAGLQPLHRALLPSKDF